MNVHPTIGNHIEELVLICKKYDVLRLFAFGSAVSGNFSSDRSDVDLIVELASMPPLQKGENLLSLWTELEKLFGCKVDLLTNKPFRNPYFRKAVEETRYLIYDREAEEISI